MSIQAERIVNIVLHNKPAGNYWVLSAIQEQMVKLYDDAPSDKQAKNILSRSELIERVKDGKLYTSKVIGYKPSTHATRLKNLQAVKRTPHATFAGVVMFYVMVSALALKEVADIVDYIVALIFG